MTEHQHTNTSPKISIITVNFNNLEGLQNTRQSILSQTFKNWEWIVIDGGSTDGDKDYIIEHKSEMAYWCSEPDEGPYNAMNKGIEKCNGEYIIFMNSGDTFYDSDTLNNVFSQPQEADVLYGDWIELFKDKHTNLKKAPHTFSIHFLFYENICHQGMFIKREVMKNSPYNEKYKIYADWAKWIEFVLKGVTFQYIPYTICYFQIGGMSNSNKVLMEEEKQRIRIEQIPAAIRETINYVDSKVNIHPLADEANRLIKKKKAYKKIIHMAIRIIHLFER